MARRKMVDRWLVGEYEFVKYDDNGETLYGFAISDHPESYELYASLDHAMAAAIAEKHTGRRGASGEAVGTAADWFMLMIGAPTDGDSPSKPSSVSVRQEFGTVESGSTIVGYRAS